MNYKKTLSLYLPTERKIKNLVMRKLLLYGYVTHTKVQKKSEFHNSDFPLHENNARSLTKPTSL